MVKRLADILQLFGQADGFKFLTHDFDPTRDNDFLKLVNKCRIVLSEASGLIPDHLYEILFGFMYGKEWEDADGNKHTFYCSSDECIQWCLNNPGVHPRNNPEFENDFEAFRNSTRIYGRGLDKIVAEAEADFPNLKINRDKRELRKVDIYTDVARIKQIIYKIISSMADVRFSGEINVTVKQLPDSSDGYHVRNIIIEQKGSFSNKSVQFIRDRVANGSGDLGSLKNIIDGNAYWSVESKWVEGPARINLIKESLFDPDFEKLDEDEVVGFRHVIKLYDKTY